MAYVLDYNVYIESLFTNGIKGIFSNTYMRNRKVNGYRIEDVIMRNLNMPNVFPSVQTVGIGGGERGLTMDHEGCVGLYYDLCTNRCISRLDSTVFKGVSCKITSDGGSLVYIGHVNGDLSVVDVRLSKGTKFGTPILHLKGCNDGMISSVYNFKNYGFNVLTSGYDDGYVRFFDIRYPYKDEFNNALPLKSFQPIRRITTKYDNFEDLDYKILSYYNIGYIYNVAVSSDESVMAIGTGNSEIFIASVADGVKIDKTGFLNSKDDLPVQLHFMNNDTFIVASCFNVVNAVASCRGHLKKKQGVTYNNPYSITKWCILSGKCNYWETIDPKERLYSDHYVFSKDDGTNLLRNSKEEGGLFYNELAIEQDNKCDGDICQPLIIENDNNNLITTGGSTHKTIDIKNNHNKLISSIESLIYVEDICVLDAMILTSGTVGENKCVSVFKSGSSL